MVNVCMLGKKLIKKGARGLRAKIITCPNKNYWYYAYIGKVVNLTGEKWVDDGLHERAFVSGVDDDIKSSLISYTTVDGTEVCSTDIQMIE